VGARSAQSISSRTTSSGRDASKYAPGSPSAVGGCRADDFMSSKAGVGRRHHPHDLATCPEVNSHTTSESATLARVASCLTRSSLAGQGPPGKHRPVIHEEANISLSAKFRGWVREGRTRRTHVLIIDGLCPFRLLVGRHPWRGTASERTSACRRDAHSPPPRGRIGVPGTRVAPGPRGRIRPRWCTAIRDLQCSTVLDGWPASIPTDRTAGAARVRIGQSPESVGGPMGPAE